MKNLLIVTFGLFLCIACVAYADPPVYSMDGIPHRLTQTGDTTQMSFIVQNYREPGRIHPFTATMFTMLNPKPGARFSGHQFDFKLLSATIPSFDGSFPLEDRETMVVKVFSGQLLNGKSQGLLTFYYQQEWGSAPVYIACELN